MTKLTDVLTLEEAERLFEYNPVSGKLIRKIDKGTEKAGNIGGGLTKSKDRITIHINSVKYHYARVCWLLHYRSIPDGIVDHVNRDATDNRIVNLRIISHGDNMHNRKMQKNNSSGYTGVHWHSGAKKWIANIRKDGKLIHLGYFINPEEASKVYREASARLFPNVKMEVENG